MCGASTGARVSLSLSCRWLSSSTRWSAWGICHLLGAPDANACLDPAPSNARQFCEVFLKCWGCRAHAREGPEGLIRSPLGMSVEKLPLQAALDRGLDLAQKIIEARNTYSPTL